MPKPKHIPTPPPQLSREIKTYRWPNSPAVVRQIGSSVFLAFVSTKIDGEEVFLMEPDAPVFFTLEQTVAWMKERKARAEARVVEADKGPPIYVPNHRGGLH